MNIFVSNIKFGTSEEEITNLFHEFGRVKSVKIIKDKESNKSRGFGFVEMYDDQDAKAAIESLNDFDFNGRKLVVKKATPKTRR